MAKSRNPPKPRPTRAKPGNLPVERAAEELIRRALLKNRKGGPPMKPIADVFGGIRDKLPGGEPSIPDPRAGDPATGLMVEEFFTRLKARFPQAQGPAAESLLRATAAQLASGELDPATMPDFFGKLAQGLEQFSREQGGSAVSPLPGVATTPPPGPVVAAPSPAPAPQGPPEVPPGVSLPAPVPAPVPAPPEKPALLPPEVPGPPPPVIVSPTTVSVGTQLDSVQELLKAYLERTGQEDAPALLEKFQTLRNQGRVQQAMAVLGTELADHKGGKEFRIQYAKAFSRLAEGRPLDPKTFEAALRRLQEASNLSADQRALAARKQGLLAKEQAAKAAKKAVSPEVQAAKVAEDLLETTARNFSEATGRRFAPGTNPGTMEGTFQDLLSSMGATKAEVRRLTAGVKAGDPEIMAEVAAANAEWTRTAKNRSGPQSPFLRAAREADPDLITDVPPSMREGWPGRQPQEPPPGGITGDLYDPDEFRPGELASPGDQFTTPPKPGPGVPGPGGKPPPPAESFMELLARNKGKVVKGVAKGAAGLFGLELVDMLTDLLRRPSQLETLALQQPIQSTGTIVDAYRAQKAAARQEAEDSRTMAALRQMLEAASRPPTTISETVI